MTDNVTLSAIDQMVASSASPSPRIGVNTTPDLRVDFNGTVTQIAPAASPGVVIDTPGLDLGAEVAGIDNQIARIEGELSEQKFDPRTGTASFVREGEERMARETLLVQLRASREYQLARNSELQAKRDAEAAAKVNADRELAAKHAFTQGNPERASALNKEIADAEARDAARVIVDARRLG
jgi:hypothetical protein